MKDPENRRKFKLLDLIMILLVIILVYVIYTTLGGDLMAITRLTESPGGSNPFKQIGEGLSAFGQGLSDLFSGMVP